MDQSLLTSFFFCVLIIRSWLKTVLVVLIFLGISFVIFSYLAFRSRYLSHLMFHNVSNFSYISRNLIFSWVHLKLIFNVYFGLIFYVHINRLSNQKMIHIMLQEVTRTGKCQQSTFKFLFKCFPVN